MVLAFIISTLTGDAPLVLYYQVYGQILVLAPFGTSSNEKHDFTVDSGTGERLRQLRRQHITRVAEQVHSEYQFRREANNLTAEEDIHRLNNDDTLPEFEVGHFRVQTPVASLGLHPADVEDDSHSIKKIQHVTWMGAALTGFILLCDSCENRAVAGQVLRLLVRFLQEHVRVLSQPSEFASRVERVAEVLERVLPDGNLLFMNHRVVRQIEKELETAMKSSS